MTDEGAGSHVRAGAFVVRAPALADAPAMARMHVASWRETYRGLMSDEVLDDPGLVPQRERFWRAAIGDERYAANRIALAQAEGEVIGVGMSGPPMDADAAWPRQLYVLYVLRAFHGSGAGAALLDAVLGPDESAALWVADPNPRAQAFYRRHGFVADGVVQTEDGISELRMRRGPHEGAR